MILDPRSRPAGWTAVLLFGALVAAVGPLHAQEAPPGGGSIHPGDEIRLRIWREEDLSGEFRVDETGQVVLPRLGVVEVDDLTPGELRDSLITAYAEYLRNPSIEVTVLRRIAVHGEVKDPTLYWVDLTMTLRDVIALAGGMTPEADPEKIYIYRGGERLYFDQAESHAVLAAELRSGDQVVVDRRSWASLNAPYLISTSISLLSILAGFLIAR